VLDVAIILSDFRVLQYNDQSIATLDAGLRFRATHLSSDAVAAGTSHSGRLSSMTIALKVASNLTTRK
jgi:hypothetical protein